MDKSLWSFLLPQWDGTAYGGLQWAFALVMLAAVVVLPLLLARSARPAQWQARLQALAGERGPLPVTTTPDQLSQAVATPAERWAAAMPGLILMLGLLGTFIGLGLALTATAGVLGPQAAPGALGAVIDALGSKFKIAAWSMLAFLILKSWITLRAHEQARLAWSIGVLKDMATAAAQAQAVQHAEEQQRLVDAIKQSGQALLAAQQAEAQRAHLRHGEWLEAMQRQSGRSS
ncbi:hypothetical protein FEE59_05795 [Herbaspirillum sp. RU 5E]|nr:hypothetical protein [Herbaspirillum sp. RU 5E]